MGSYDIEKNEVYIHYKMPLLYTLSHEICHLYYYNFLNKNFKRYNKIRAWRLSEVIVNFLLNRTKLKKLWPDEEEYYYNTKNIGNIWKD